MKNSCWSRATCCTCRRTTRTTASPSATARPIRSASARRPIRNWARPSCNSWPTRSTCRAAMPIRIWKPAPSRPRSRAMLDTVAEEMNKVRFTDDDVTIFLGEHLSEPKHNVFFKGPAKPLAVGKFQDAATKKGLSLSRKTQMLYRGKHVFINGESFAIGRADKATLEALANARALDGAALAAASEDVLDALYTWYTDGWIGVG